MQFCTGRFRNWKAPIKDQLKLQIESKLKLEQISWSFYCDVQVEREYDEINVF